MTLVTVVTDGSPPMILLNMVIFGSPSIITSFTTGVLPNTLYSVITWSPSTLSSFEPVSITWVNLLTLISGSRISRERRKKDYLITDLRNAILPIPFTSATCITKQSPGLVDLRVFCAVITTSKMITQNSINSKRSTYMDSSQTAHAMLYPLHNFEALESDQKDNYQQMLFYAGFPYLTTLNLSM